MALTATATPALRSQLIACLRDPVQEVSTINKPNISFHAIELTGLPKHGALLCPQSCFNDMYMYV